VAGSSADGPVSPLSPALNALQDDAHPALDGLVRLIVDELLDGPVSRWVDVEGLAAAGARGIRAAAETDGLPDDHPLHDAIARRLDDPRPLGEMLPPGLDEVVEPVLRVPWTPSEELVLRLLRHDAARMLVRETLANTLQRFATRARSLDEGVLGGLGGKAFKRGRGLLGSVGSAAEGLVGAVSKEVEQAVEARIKDFLGGATDEALKGIAAWVADEQHAEPMARLRVSAWHELRATSARGLLGTAAEDVGAWEKALLDGLGHLAGRDDLEAHLATLLREGLAEVDGTSLRSWLPDPALADALHDAGRAALVPGLRTLVRTEAFATWWSGLPA